MESEEQRDTIRKDLCLVVECDRLVFDSHQRISHSICVKCVNVNQTFHVHFIKETTSSHNLKFSLISLPLRASLLSSLPYLRKTSQ